MIQRTFDAALINSFANHPDINPALGGQQLDFSGAIRDGTVFLFGEHGGYIFEWCAPGFYEGHVMLTRPGRGAWGLNALREALAALDANVWARVNDRALAWFVTQAGFREVERRTLYAPAEAEWRIFEWRK